MKPEDYGEFAALWQACGEMSQFQKAGGFSTTVLTLAFNTLAQQGFTLQEIRTALQQHIIESPDPPTVCAVSAIIRRMRGEDEASVKAKAKRIFAFLESKLYPKICSFHDVVIGDVRTAAAVRRAFGSNLNELGDELRMLEGTKIARAQFVREYCGLRPEDFAGEGGVFPTTFTEMPIHAPVFIGAYPACKAMAERYYRKAGLSYRLPGEPRQCGAEVARLLPNASPAAPTGVPGRQQLAELLRTMTGMLNPDPWRQQAGSKA